MFHENFLDSYLFSHKLHALIIVLLLLETEKKTYLKTFF